MRGIWAGVLVAAIAIGCESATEDPISAPLDGGGGGGAAGDGSTGGGGQDGGGAGGADGVDGAGGTDGGGGGGNDGGGPPPDAGPPDPDAAPGPDAGPLNAVGGECVNELDCASNFCLDTEFARALITDPVDAEAVVIPDGYCTMLNCQDNAACGGDPARCVDLPGTGIDVPFNACFQTCAPDTEGECREDHTCYCDVDGNILDVDGNRELCLCLPEILEEFLRGE